MLFKYVRKQEKDFLGRPRTATQHFHMRVTNMYVTVEGDHSPIQFLLGDIISPCVSYVKVCGLQLNSSIKHP